MNRSLPDPRSSPRMSTTTPTSAEHNGHAWGLRARDWSETETQQRPDLRGGDPARRHRRRPDRARRRLRQRRLPARRRRPRRRPSAGSTPPRRCSRSPASACPTPTSRMGDLQHLPYVDDSFDAVTGFNSFFFADDMVAALREAGRVAKPGAPVVIQVWGRPERFDLAPDEGRARSLPPAAAGRPARPDRRCGSPACSRTSPRRPGLIPDARLRRAAGRTSTPTRSR